MMLLDRKRCKGSYDNINGEFGKIIRRECIGCIRRDWFDDRFDNPRPEVMAPPEFSISCPMKVSDMEST